MEESNRIIKLTEGVPAAVIESGTEGRPACAPATTLISAQWLVLYLERGEGRLEGATYSGRVVPGTLLSIPPGRTSYEITGGKLTLLSLREPPKSALGDSPFSFPLVRPLSRFEGRRWQERIEGVAHRIARHQYEEADAVALRTELAEIALGRGQGPAHETIHEAMRLLWGQLERPVRLTALAAELGYSANYLNDLSRHTTGRSLGRWLGDMRMSRARELLTASELPVGEAGARSGYDDPAYFSRVFRRIHGVTPLEWRIAHRPRDPRFAALTIPFEAMKSMESAAAISM